MAEADKKDDFEPYDNRSIPHTISSLSALINFLKSAIGTGIFAMPNVFSKSGMYVGMVSMVFFGWLVAYTLHILFKCQYELCKIKKVGWMAYSDSMAAALEEGPPSLRKLKNAGKIAVVIMLTSYQVGCMIIYIQFVAENIKAVGNIWNDNIAIEMYMLIILLPCMAIMMVKNLKKFTPLSYVANVITIGSFSIVMYYILTDLPDFDSRDKTKSILKYPLFFGTTIFSLHSIALVLHIEKHMNNPKSFRKWNGCLNIAMTILTVFYLIFAVLGYWKYGDEALGSVTLNFPEENLASVCKGLYGLAILISYGLQGIVPVDMLWYNLFEKKLSDEPEVAMYWEYLVRICIVLGTFLFAVLIPCLASCISLSGAFNLSILAMLMPATMDFCLHYKTRGFWIFRALFVFSIGTLGMVTGCVLAVQDIYECVSERS